MPEGETTTTRTTVYDGYTRAKWGTPNFTRMLATYFLRFWIIVDIIAILLVFVGQGFIMQNSITRYDRIYGTGKAPRGPYTADGAASTDGWVLNTNVPQHYGGVYFSSAFQASIMVFLLLALASETVVLCANKRNWWSDILVMFYANGLVVGEYQWEGMGANVAVNADNRKRLVPFYAIANAFLKLFIVVLYESQSFGGISHGEHAPGGTGNDTNRFCLVAGWILLGSIIPGVVSQFYCFLLWSAHDQPNWEKPWGQA